VTTDVYSSESKGGACLWLEKTHGPRSKSETRSWSISLKGQAQPADLAETTSAGVRDSIRNRQHRPRFDVDGESRTVATTQPMPRQDVARVPQHAEAPDRRDSSINTTFPSPFSWQIDMPAIAMLVAHRQGVLAARPVYHPPSSATTTAREHSLSCQAEIL
jgi:hypothetical protein